MSTSMVPSRYRILPEEVWSEVRRQYERGRSPLELCRLYGISKSTFMGRRRRDNWSRQASNCKRLGRDSAPGARGTSVGATAGRRLEQPVRVPSGSLEQELAPDLCDRVQALAATVATPAVQVSIPSVNNEELLGLTRCLRFRIEGMLADERLGAGPQGRRSRAVVDLATALEKLLKIERTVLGIDGGLQRSGPQVVIVVPAKLSDEEWAAAVSNRIAPD